MRKTLLALTGAAALALATSANAAVEIDFNNPTGTLGTSQVYTDGGALSVTAYGYTGGVASNLYGKNDAAADEKGVGLASDTSGQHEIWYNPNTYIALDMTDLFAEGVTGASFFMGSTTLGEEWAVYGSDLAGTLGVQLLTGTDEGMWHDLPNWGDYDFYQFVSLGTQHVGSPATRGNVLLGGIAANAVPEPATWGMMLLGFGAVGFSMRRRRRIALTQLA